MKFISLASLLFLPIILSRKYLNLMFISVSRLKIFDIHSSEDVKFGDSGSAPESQTKIEEGDNGSGNSEITEEDVNERFINLDLGDFGNNVAASALGTVIGNVGTNLAGNFLNGCSNRGRRSVLMHKIEKRQAIEANQKTGNSEEDPEVAERFLPCPQQFLNPGGNNGRYCDRCYCSDWDCRRDCRKCSYSNGPNNWSSNSGSSNNGWRNGVNGRTGSESDDSEVIVEQTSSKKESS